MTRVPVAALLLAAAMTLPGCPAPRPDARAGAESGQLGQPGEAAGQAASPPDPAGPARVLQGSAVSDGGRVEVVVSYAGLLTDEVVTVDRDPSACGGEGPRPAGALIVSDGRLAGAVVWIEGPPSGAPMPPSTVTIENDRCAFVPRVSVGFVGGKVAVRNSDPVLHGTSLRRVEDDRSLGNLALPEQGMVIERNLRAPGRIELGCDVHAWMRGWLLVFDHSHAAVSDQAGLVTLDAVPPGTHPLKAWHERLGEVAGSVTVPPGGTARVELAFPAGT